MIKNEILNQIYYINELILKKITPFKKIRLMIEDSTYSILLDTFRLDKFELVLFIGNKKECLQFIKEYRKETEKEVEKC